VINSNLESLKDVQPIFVLSQQELAPPANNHQPMFGKNAQSLFESQTMRTAVHQREDVDAKGVVHLGAFVERGEDLLGVGIFV